MKRVTNAQRFALFRWLSENKDALAQRRPGLHTIASEAAEALNLPINARLVSCVLKESGLDIPTHHHQSGQTRSHLAARIKALEHDLAVLEQRFNNHLMVAGPAVRITTP